MKKLFIIIFVLIHSISLYSQLSWEKKIVDSTFNFEIVQFLNSQTGYISGNHVSNYWSSNIYKTTNSGNNWFTTGLAGGHNTGIYFINASTGLASTFAPPGLGTLLRTGNGGISWQIIRTIQGASPGNLYFFDDLNCFYSATNNSIYKSTDSGFNWFQIPLPVEYILEIFFVDINKGYLSSDTRIIKTTNGGYNWSHIYYTNYLPTINDIVFLDSLNGYFAGKLSTGAIFKTTNGGYNWDLVFTTTERLRKVIFPTYNVGYALGDSTRIYRTSNAGYNWISQNLDSSYKYSDVSFANEYTGFIVGQRGIVLRTTNGGLTFINQEINETPSKYSLGQNYPNPFNPETAIRFQVTGNSIVAIKVYDVMGREVETLVNERLQPGSYEVTFDGSGLNSGVYFYRMVTDEYSETRRMVLIK